MSPDTRQAPEGQPTTQAPVALSKRLAATTLSMGPILVGFALLCTAIALSGCGVESATPANLVRAVKTETVTVGNGTISSTYPGTIQPRRESQLGFRVAGKVAKRYVQIGQSVAPGKVLATLEQDDLGLRVKAAEAQMRAAAAEAEQARVDVQRYTLIKNSPAFSQAVYDKRTNTLDAAVARLRDTESQVKLAKNQLEYSTLVADDFGVVTATNIEPGQVVAQGQTAIVVARSSDLDVVVSIPEAKLADIERADVRVTIWSQPGESLPARVREVAASADPTTRTYAVKFALDEMPDGLQIGMSATLTLASKAQSSIAEIPLSAVFEHNGQPSVWTVDAAGQLTAIPVTVSGYRNASALIGSGLKTGDVVVTAGVHKLDVGQKVRPLTAAAAS